MSEYQAHAKWLGREPGPPGQHDSEGGAREIVRQQDAFLSRVQQLRPLNLRTVADAIGMHESTVSRVTVQQVHGDPRGIFEMKFFFTRAHRRHRIRDEAHIPPKQFAIVFANWLQPRARPSCPTTIWSKAQSRKALRLPAEQ